MKLALEGRVITPVSVLVSVVASMMAAAATSIDTFYHFLLPPTIVSRKRNKRANTIHVLVDVIEDDCRGDGEARRDTRQVIKGWIGGRGARRGNKWEIAVSCKAQARGCQ